VRYLLLIYENEDTWRALPSDERRRQIEGYDDVRRRAETGDTSSPRTASRRCAKRRRSEGATAA
jgi:hypothetical protein